MAWQKIEGFENYSINEMGDVRNEETGRFKRPHVNTANNYLYVDLWKDNKSYKRPVHRLLAETFIPNPDKKPTVDHKDGNRQNNSLSNLRWATYAEQNSRFNTVGIRSERVRVTHYIEKRKKRGGGHDEWLEADKVMYFDRINDVAAFFELTPGSITQMLKAGSIGRRGKTRGYKFEYANSQRSHGNERVTTTETKESTQ